MRLKIHTDHDIKDFVLGPRDHIDVRDGLINVFVDGQCAPVATLASRFVTHIEIVPYVGPERAPIIPVLYKRPVNESRWLLEYWSCGNCGWKNFFNREHCDKCGLGSKPLNEK
jgi:hypothetical protein